MTDKELFDRTFLKMHASEDTLKEVYSVIERKESRAYSKRIGFIVAAVAVMIALSVTAFAVHRRWSPFLADAFGVSEPQQSELLDLAVERDLIQKSGSWFSYKDERIGQGKDNTRKYLKEHPEVFNEIEAVIREEFSKGKLVMDEDRTEDDGEDDLLEDE